MLVPSVVIIVWETFKLLDLGLNCGWTGVVLYQWTNERHAVEIVTAHISDQGWMNSSCDTHLHLPSPASHTVDLNLKANASLCSDD